MIKSFKIAANKGNLQGFLSFLEAELEDKTDMGTLQKVLICAEEIYMNVTLYAYEPISGDVTIDFDIDDNKMMSLSFFDTGTPYNPLAKKDPNVKAGADERDIGGLGIFMVKNMMDEVTYEYKDGNKFTLFKKL